MQGNIITLIDIPDIPTLVIEGMFDGSFCTIIVPDLDNFNQEVWERVDAYYRSNGFPDYVSSGQFEKYVRQVIQNVTNKAEQHDDKNPTDTSSYGSKKPSGSRHGTQPTRGGEARS